jgi:hypothetical protein
MAVVATLEKALPPVIDPAERRQMAYSLVPQALDDIIGKDKWATEKRPKKQGSGLVTYVILKKSQ